MQFNSVLLLLTLAAVSMISSCETETPQPLKTIDPPAEKTCKILMVLDRGDQIVYEIGYNSSGEVVRVVDERGTSTYPNDFWNDRNNKVGVLYNSFNLRSEFSFKLDGKGKVIERQLKDSLSGQIRYWDYTYNSEGKLLEILESKENPGTGFKEQVGKEKYTHNGDNVFREELFTIDHNQGTSPKVSIAMTREYSYDSNHNPLFGLFFNGPSLKTINKNNVVLIREIPSGGSLNTIAFSYVFNDEKYPQIRNDRLGVILLKYSYTDC